MLVAAALLGCGTGTSHIPNGKRQFISISISPVTAESQVQYTATGTYSDGTKISPLTALWSVGNPWVQPANPIATPSVDATGLACCTDTNGTITGTFTIEATAPVDPHIPISQMGPTTPQVDGTAQLTCP